MSVLPALITVLERSAADRLVLCPGDRPHILTPGGRRDVGTAALSPTVVAALAGEILSPAALDAVKRREPADEQVRRLDNGDVLAVRAHYVGDEMRLELSRTRSSVQAALAPVAEAAAATPLTHWIARAREQGATALYLRPGAPLAARIRGRVQAFGDTTVDAALFAELQSIRPDDQIGPVTCRTVTDAQGPCAVLTFHRAASRHAGVASVPRTLHDVCESRDGLLAVAAPTADELCRLVAAAAEFSGTRRGGYVVLVEPGGMLPCDIHAPFVSRRVVMDGDMADAITSATAEDPDVLAVFAPRSPRDVQAALDAAKGRLVIIGVVASTVVDALRQMAAALDPRHHRALAEAFQAGISCRRLRRLGGGHVIVRDVLRASAETRAALEVRDFAQLAAAHRAGITTGVSADAALAQSVVRGHISLRCAVAHASDPSQLVSEVRREARDRRRGVTASVPAAMVHDAEWADLSAAI